MLHDHAAFSASSTPVAPLQALREQSLALGMDCPVARLGREYRALADIGSECQEAKLEDFVEAAFDRELAIPEEVSFLQATSLSGALFQIAVAYEQLSEIAELGVILAEKESATEIERDYTKREIKKLERIAHRNLRSAAALALSLSGSDDVGAGRFFSTDYDGMVMDAVRQRLAGTLPENCAPGIIETRKRSETLATARDRLALNGASLTEAPKA